MLDSGKNMYSQFLIFINNRCQYQTSSYLKVMTLDCPKCSGTIVYPEGLSGEKTCSQCGLVIDEMPAFQISANWVPEWHSNWDEDDSETTKQWLTNLRSVSCQLHLPDFPLQRRGRSHNKKPKQTSFQISKTL